MQKFTRSLVAATAVTFSMLAAASPAHAVVVADTITIKSTNGAVRVCSAFGCVLIVPPCQCSKGPKK